ncbi:MAG: hypothetical protein LBQ16_06445, partial [Gracilibacteraceae bacterium]|nr:hypothetical protein [Gracilibacteraceae bacterium]
SILQAGSAVLRAYKNADGNYNPIAADMTVIVQKKANTLTVNVPDVEFGTPVTAAVTENESGGLLTYSWQGRGATAYGPSAAPPTAIGEYTLTAVSEETVNYKGAQAGTDFKIKSCACAVSAVSFDIGDIAIDYYEMQGTRPVNTDWDFVSCGQHGRVFDVQYEFAGEHAGASIDGAYPAPVTLEASSLTAGKELTVRAKITHTPTGLTEIREARVKVSKAPRADTAAQSYRKTTDDDLAVSVSALLKEGPVSNVTYNPGVPGQKIQTLSEGQDYKVENNSLVFTKSFMDTLPPGERDIAVSFGGGPAQIFHVSVANGVLTVDKTAAASSALTLSTPMSDAELAGAVLSPQESAKLANGFDVKIELITSGPQNSGDAAVVAANASGKTAGVLFDVSIRKTVGREAPALVEAVPNGTVKLLAHLPQNMQGFPRYWLGRVERPVNGKASMSLLGARLQNNSLLFETNHFSTYAILYTASVVNIDSDKSTVPGAGGSGGGSGNAGGSGNTGAASVAPVTPVAPVAPVTPGTPGAAPGTPGTPGAATVTPVTPGTPLAPAPPGTDPKPGAERKPQDSPLIPPPAKPKVAAGNSEAPLPNPNPKTGSADMGSLGLFSALTALSAALITRAGRRLGKKQP